MLDLINKLILLAFVVSACSVAVVAQVTEPCQVRSGVIRDSSRPSVYLTFEKKGQLDKSSKAEASERIWLRLHNNTGWAILIYTQDYYEKSMFAPLRICGVANEGLRDGMEIGPLYSIEAAGEKAVVPKIDWGHMILDPSIWLPSGQSLIFSVPAEHLGKHLRVSISFSYEWEWKRLSDGRLDQDFKEPFHRAWFESRELPVSLRPR